VAGIIEGRLCKEDGHRRPSRNTYQTSAKEVGQISGNADMPAQFAFALDMHQQGDVGHPFDLQPSVESRLAGQSSARANLQRSRVFIFDEDQLKSAMLFFDPCQGAAAWPKIRIVRGTSCLR
jgi:hypothetical protein